MIKFYSFVLMFVSFASAEIQTLGIFKQGDDVDLVQTCASCTYNNITSVISPNSTEVIGNFPMTKTGSVYKFTLGSDNTTQFGTYIVNGIGDLDGADTIWSYDFKVNYRGAEVTSSQSILYVVLFMVLFFTFILILFGINELPESNRQDEEGRILSVTYLKYLRPALWFVEWMIVIAILYLSSNLAFAFLTEQLFAKILFMLFQITFGITPIIVIVWMVWIYVQMFHDKQFQAMLNRGIFPQGKLP